MLEIFSASIDSQQQIKPKIYAKQKSTNIQEYTTITTLANQSSQHLHHVSK